MKEIRIIQILITIISLAIALVHVIFPNIRIDSITIILFIVAVIPWLFPLFKSLELPGGFKFEFQELERIKREAENVGLVSDSLSENDGYDFIDIAEKDPNLALVSLRIELEKSLKELARLKNIDFKRRGGISFMMKELYKKEIISNEERNILLDIIGTLNKAAHGEDYDYKIARWVIDFGPKILDNIKKRSKSSKK